mgnify:CR=1 FL=1
MSYLLTVDVDWASTEDIDLTLDVLQQLGLTSTWMLTNEPTERLLEASRSGCVEFGIHPNFLPGSSHGSTVEEVLSTVMSFAPEARVMRTHSLFQYGGLWPQVLSQTNITLDSSLFLPDLSSPQLFRMKFASRTLIRVPFVWADDYALIGGQQSQPVKTGYSTGVPWVFMVHPVHVATAVRLEGSPELALESLSSAGSWSVSREQAGYQQIMEALRFLSAQPSTCRFLSEIGVDSRQE